jgi:hypothetical protein
MVEFVAEFVVGESVLFEEPISDYEALRVFFDLAEERGHLSPSLVIDDTEQVLTHRDYSDRFGLVHPSAGAWLFCRRPMPEALGVIEGASWAREVAPHLLADEVPYPGELFFGCQLYLHRFDSDDPVMLSPVHKMSTFAVAPDGMRTCVVGESFDSGDMLLWEYELAMGTRRLVARLPRCVELLMIEVSYSSDGRWLLICGSGQCRLVRVSDGLVIRLPVHAEAAAWNPRNGPNAVVSWRPIVRPAASSSATMTSAPRRSLHGRRSIAAASRWMSASWPWTRANARW